MALVIADRVRETTTTTGTGAVTLAGAYTSFQSFLAAVGNGNSTYYTIASAVTGEWEVGIGTYTSASNTLSRTTVLASSNAGSLVNFSSGAKDVFVTQPAERSILVQSAGSGLFSGVAAFTANGVPYANSTSTLTTGSGLTFDGTTLSASNISSAGSWTFSGGTANGVLYLNGSKVATSGSALKFDGTDLMLGANSFVIKNAISDGNGLRIYQAASDVSTLMNYYNGSMVFGIGNSEKMRLTSTGLGIGTSSPAYKLDVTGQIRAAVYNGSAQIRLERTGTSSTGASWIGADADALLRVYTTGFSTQLMLDSSGNLGLGVTPSAWGIGKVLQISAAGGAFLYGANGQSISGINAYYDTSWKYGATGYASYYEQSSGAHKWNTAASGTAGNAISFTQAMTLDASGNLGVGSTSPLSAVGRCIQVYNSGASVATLQLQDSTTGSGASDGLQLQASGVTSYLWNYENGPLIFGTNNTERARITSGGYFKASNSGTYYNSSGSQHELRSSFSGADIAVFSHTSATDPYGIYLTFTAASPNNTTNYFLYCSDSTAQRATIRSNGGLANYSANDVNLSDRREKTNFAPAKSYLDTICAIPVQTFNYIDQAEDDSGTTLGVVAQDVQAVAPELVMESNWGTEEEPKMRLSIYQTDLQYALMKCIQEQQVLIQQLTARVAQLESN